MKTVYCFANSVNCFTKLANCFYKIVNEFSKVVNEFSKIVNEFSKTVNEFWKTVNRFSKTVNYSVKIVLYFIKSVIKLFIIIIFNHIINLNKMSKSSRSNCKRDYRLLEGTKLENKAEGVKNGIYGSTGVFATPTLTLLVVAALLLEYSNNRLAWEQGGIAQKKAYLDSMKKIIAMLDTLADYVDTVAVGDITTIKMAGYDATFDPTGAIPKPGLVRIDGISLDRLDKGTEIMVSDCGTLPKGTSVIGILTEGAPLPATTIIDSDGNIVLPPGFTGKVRINIARQRKKFWRNLTIGVNYYVYYIAVTAKSVSLLSLPVSELCG